MSSELQQLERLRTAVISGDVDTVLACIESHPQLIHGQPVVDTAWSDAGRRLGPQDRVVECVWLLSKHGAKFASLSVSALDNALKYFPRAASVLLAAGADPQVTNEVGATLLHRMARIGSRSGLKTLFHYAVDLNRKTNQGATPLDVAIRRGHLHLSQYLYERGAKPSIEDFKPQALPPAAEQVTVSIDEGQQVGTVLWFEPKKWGYVDNQVYGDLFFSVNEVVHDVPKSIEEGDMTTFRIDRDHYGLKAVEVEIVKLASPK